MPHTTHAMLQASHPIQHMAKGTVACTRGSGALFAVRDARHVHVVEQLRLKRRTAEQVCLRMRASIAEAPLGN